MLHISDKNAVLDTISEVKNTLSSDDNWTRTGEAMTKTGQSTSPTNNNAASFNLTGAIKRGVHKIGEQKGWRDSQIDQVEQEVEAVFGDCLQTNFGYNPTVDDLRADRMQTPSNHPGEMLLNNWSASAEFNQAQELISSAQERVINYSD